MTRSSSSRKDARTPWSGPSLLYSTKPDAALVNCSTFAFAISNGKTSTRSYVSTVRQELQDHPYKDNPNSLLWISKHAAYEGKPLHWIGVQRILQRTYRKANIRKKDNAHWLRHSRATLLASRYTEQILCALMGWTLGSKQVRTYVHLSAGQVEDAFLSNNKLTERAPAPAQVQHCVCGATNSSGAKYCYQCGNPLSTATIIEAEQLKTRQREDKDQALLAILADPEQLKRMQGILGSIREPRRAIRNAREE